MNKDKKKMFTYTNTYIDLISITILISHSTLVYFGADQKKLSWCNNKMGGGWLTNAGLVSLSLSLNVLYWSIRIVDTHKGDRLFIWPVMWFAWWIYRHCGLCIVCDGRLCNTRSFRSMRFDNDELPASNTYLYL